MRTKGALNLNMPRASLRLCWVLLFSFQAACGVGSYGDEQPKTTADIDPAVDAQQLDIQLSGKTRYLAGEIVTLGYEVTGDYSASATVTYEGPVELEHKSEDKEVSGTLPAGVYSVRVTATSGSTSATDEAQVTSDAFFSGSYQAVDTTGVSLVAGRSSVSDVDENNYVLTRTGKLYWFAQDVDDGFVDLLCAAEITIEGANGTGAGFCKELITEVIQAYEISAVSISVDSEGQIELAYLPDGNTGNLKFNFSSSGEAYVNPDIDISGVYRSQLLADLNFVIISGSEISGDSYGNSVSRCNLTGTVMPYEEIEASQNQSIDGSVIPVSELTIDNCDLSDQQGYIVSVGLADGSAQQGLIQIFESGVSDSVLRFDLYAERGLEFDDPISKLRFERICFGDVATSVGIGVVDNADCQELMAENEE